MRATLALVLALGLGACESVSDKPDPLAGDIIDEAELTDVLLTSGDAATGINYFSAALEREPERADFRRGLAVSLARAKRLPESARLYQEMLERGEAESADRLNYAHIAIRLERWDEARGLLAGLPPEFQTARRAMLEGLMADHDQNWSASDIAYAEAVSLSQNPVEILNNWGVSQMSRGDLGAAVKTFERAISYDSRPFAPKNNLAIARGLQGDFQLPVVPMTDRERAVILNNLGVIAARQGQPRVARGLFAAAVEAHPQHYQAAADRLAALEATLVD